jgi:hypothetical protein
VALSQGLLAENFTVRLTFFSSHTSSRSILFFRIFSHVGILMGMDCKVGCAVAAVDTFGGEGRGTFMVAVKPSSLPIAQLGALSEAKVAEFLATGNALASGQILAATSAALKSAVNTVGNRRQLMGSTSSFPEAATVRANVLVNLILTNKITPVTTNGIASLIAVLVGIVEAPWELTDATSRSAMKFLHMVR